MSALFDSFLDELEARTRINDVLLRFCRGIDRKDWEMLRSVYHADAIDDHGNFIGPISEYVEFTKSRHDASIEHSMHLLSNVFITFLSTDCASVESYVFASQRERWSDDESSNRVFIWARYADRFERREGVWKIALRTVVFGDLVSVPVTRQVTFPDTYHTQKRDGTDPIELQEAALRGLSSDQPGIPA